MFTRWLDIPPQRSCLMVGARRSGKTTLLKNRYPDWAYATLDDFWDGSAYWHLDIYDTGLPVGESDTVHRGGEEYWSYLHASYQSAGVVDQCGDPVPFPGCTTLWKSHDGGRSFVLENPVCLFECETCPCDNERDHIPE